MANVRVLLLRAAGTNCDRECTFAWQRAGAHVEPMHVRDLSERPDRLREFQILTIPGGFSYGDDIAAGRIFAAQIERHLRDDLLAFIDAGRLILGICNGFQVLVKAGLLPFPHESAAQRCCTVTYNAPAGFQDRWIALDAQPSPCVFTTPGRRYEMPIAHGEGRVRFASDAVRQRVISAGLAAVTYCDAPAGPPGAPANPNGSELDIAGLCDPTGRVFGLMPHPDRFTEPTQHPCWTSREAAVGDGLHMFQQAVTQFV